MAEFGVGPGTTVIASTLTFIATVGPAVHRGATPVFIDSDPATGTISIPLLDQALRDLSRRPALVIAADIYGQCCDYEALERVGCKRRGEGRAFACSNPGGRKENPFGRLHE